VGWWVFGVCVAVIHHGGPTFIYVRAMSMHTHRLAGCYPTYLIVRAKMTWNYGYDGVFLESETIKIIGGRS
jgi:hypothetical protein